MPISFMVKEARDRLENRNFVFTLRPQFRTTGKNWYNYRRGDTKKGDVYIIFIGYYKDREDELEPFVKGSGFNSLEDWLKKAKKSRYLFKVSLI